MSLETIDYKRPPIDGSTFNQAKDGKRLGRQFLAVKGLMSDGKWRTLRAIADQVGASEASVSARLRDLRKEKFGGFVVDRRRHETREGVFEYRLQVGGAA